MKRKTLCRIFSRACGQIIPNDANCHFGEKSPKKFGSDKENQERRKYMYYKKMRNIKKRKESFALTFFQKTKILICFFIVLIHNSRNKIKGNF